MSTTRLRPRLVRHHPRGPLEPPQAILLAVALVIGDVVVLIAMNLLTQGVGCASVACQNAHTASTATALGALALAVAVTVVPIVVAALVGRGLRTVAVVQLVAGALLVLHAAGFVSAARAARLHPPAPVGSVVYVPCVEATLRGQTCVSQPPQSP